MDEHTERGGKMQHVRIINVRLSLLHTPSEAKNCKPIKAAMKGDGISPHNADAESLTGNHD